MLRFLSIVAFSISINAVFAQSTPVPYLTESGKYQYVDRATMQPVTGTIYEIALPYSSGLAVVSTGHESKYIKPDGQPGIDNTFDEAGSFRGTRAVVFKNKMSYLIDNKGKAHPSSYRVQEWGISEDRAVVTDENGKFGYIELGTSLKAVPCIYEFARPYSEGFGAVKINGKWGFIDKGGKILIPATYDDVTAFGEGLAGVRVNNKWGVINRDGKMVISTRYDKITPFVDGHAFVKITDGSWGVIDTKGTPTSASLPYQVIIQLSDGLAGFMHDNVWGYIDVHGKEIIPASYIRVASFSDGLAMVMKDGKRFYIDKSGKEFRK